MRSVAVLPVTGESKGTGTVLRGFVWVAFAAVLLRFMVLWADAAGASLPRPGSVVFTLVFSAFSLAHATSVFGWRRAVSFLLICAAVSWCFEEVGVDTGLIYGHYHYGRLLGAKVGAVPIIIPLAWFMMIYASWMVAHVLLQGAGDPAALPGSLARSLVASAVMTSWDVVMDPGKAREGSWTWENGGAYFGVPLQNFPGWMVTTFAVYGLTAMVFRRLAAAPSRDTSFGRHYVGLPVFAYAFVALDRVLIATMPALHIVAAFGMSLLAAVAVIRLALTPEPISLP